MNQIAIVPFVLALGACATPHAVRQTKAELDAQIAAVQAALQAKVDGDAKQRKDDLEALARQHQALSTSIANLTVILASLRRQTDRIGAAVAEQQPLAAKPRDQQLLDMLVHYVGAERTLLSPRGYEPVGVTFGVGVEAAKQQFSDGLKSVAILEADWRQNLSAATFQDAVLLPAKLVIPLEWSNGRIAVATEPTPTTFDLATAATVNRTVLCEWKAVEPRGADAVQVEATVKAAGADSGATLLWALSPALRDCDGKLRAGFDFAVALRGDGTRGDAPVMSGFLRPVWR